MRKLGKERYITIFGSTGDLGSQLANYLVSKNQRLHLITREGHFEKLRKRVNVNKKVKVKVASSVFDTKLLNNVFKSSKVIFNLSGLVSISFSKKAYPNVLVINSVFPALLMKLNVRYKLPIVYASTQRIKNFSGRNEINNWVERISNEISNYIKNYKRIKNLEASAISFVKDFLTKHPVPANTNIYDLSKLVAERLFKEDNKSIVLRISSCYGPGCSTRRTVGRLIFARLLGQNIIEKEEIRDYIFARDINEAFDKIINLNTHGPYIRDCCSGTSISKSFLINRILEATPNDKGTLMVSKIDNVEIFNPSSKWLKSFLNRDMANLDLGISKTVSYIRKSYFFKDSMSTAKERLAAQYDVIRQKTEERGVSATEIEKIKNMFFSFSKNKWRAHEAFWKPTGLVFGYPFPPALYNKFDRLRKEIQTKLKLKYNECWLLDKKLLHSTIVSYSHYLEIGMKVIPFPRTVMPNVREIVSNHKPVEISFKGVLVTDNGSLLMMGLVDDEELFELRKDLMSGVSGITQKSQNLVHVKLAQFLVAPPYESVESINRLYSTVDLGTHTFSSVTDFGKNKIYFGK